MYVHRSQGRLQWARPAGGGTAFVRVLKGDGNQAVVVDDADFTARLALARRISVVPGGFCFGDGGGGDDFRGYIRIALGEVETLREALPILEEFVVKGYY